MGGLSPIHTKKSFFYYYINTVTYLCHAKHVLLVNLDSVKGPFCPKTDLDA